MCKSGLWLVCTTGYRDAQKGTEQAGSTGKKQDGHRQSMLSSRSAHELKQGCFYQAVLCQCAGLLRSVSTAQFTSYYRKARILTTVCTKKSCGTQKDSAPCSWGHIPMCLIPGWHQQELLQMMQLLLIYASSSGLRHRFMRHFEIQVLNFQNRASKQNNKSS